jgi:hypothetical protein
VRIKIKEFLIMFGIQILNYSLLCINYRAVAHANYIQSAVSDFVIASLSFFVIKKIANGEDTTHQWLGYALGGVVGSIIGIYLSTVMLGK